MYSILVYLHVISAVMAIGPFGVLFPLLKRMKDAETEEQLQRDLDTFKFVVSTSKHTGHLLVSTGALLVWLGPWTWKTPWILVTLIILFSALFFFARAFSPLLRKVKEQRDNRPVLLRKLNRTLSAYLIILLIMLWFMVTKPALW